MTTLTLELSPEDYVVAYDIEDDNRRNRVAKTLENYGTRVQYSVFERRTELKRYIELKDRLEKLIDLQKDSVIFYHLCARCELLIDQVGLTKKILDKAAYIV